MSTTKRPRQRRTDADSNTALPPAKRTKFGRDEQDKPTSLAFLTDERKRAGKTIEAKTTNGINTARIDRADESKPAVSGADQVDDSEDLDAASDGESEVSSSSEAPSSESDVDEDEDEDVPKTNGLDKHDDQEMEDVSDTADTQGKLPNNAHNELALTNGVGHEEGEPDAATEPSFGDMLQATHPEVIDVAASFNELVPSKAVVPADNSKVLQAPSATSLGTVLTQALRTNDKDLLESCLQTKDLVSIKSTIQRLQSPLVATLMQKLAERLHKRPGRAGPLMVWVQWSLVTHGGYLASQPQVVRRLRSLRQVIRERANSLPSLITLKGKLDMLSAQVELRRSMKAQRAYQDESDEDEADVVYVEGVDNDESSSEEDTNLAVGKRKVLTTEESGAVSDLDMDGDVPLINGIDDDADMQSMGEEDEDDLEVGNGLIDDEAEESENEESMSSEEDASGSESDEDDEADDSSSDDDGVDDIPAPAKGRPIKRNALIRKR
ncbi:Dip2/Utp12 family-domain-containing protein [Elsinoe ampelina]|uniref:Dip2/Utp12 family-domain-containing protein n=1 Tax=Elsinoe ampelina TaxID=302913 RepID=A0A6A6GRS8_9PEZI|nr:Dip2/Utp12 family-domain-containing protein [Elsinoe ampelina]